MKRAMQMSMVAFVVAIIGIIGYGVYAQYHPSPNTLMGKCRIVYEVSEVSAITRATHYDTLNLPDSMRVTAMWGSR